MKKSLFSAIVLFLATCALVLPAKIQALNIQLHDDGTVVVLPGNVLGDSTEGEKKEETSSNKGSEKKTENEVRPAEVRSTATRAVELNKEEMKKREEQKREMTIKSKKDLEQANRVKRMFENKKSSVELELRKDGADVELKMREFEKMKKNNEEGKQTEGEKQNEQRGVDEKNRTEGQQSAIDKQEGNRKNENENENEKRTIRSTVEEKTDGVNVKVGSTDIRSTDKGFEIEKGDVKVQTQLPVSVEADTKQLSIITPLGTKTVTTLPDEAKNTVESSGLASQVVGDITLKQSGEDVVFHMNTVQSKRMFGFVPVRVNREVEVSATTGQITNTTQSLGQRFLNFFSL